MSTELADNKDLTTTAGADIDPNDTNLETPIGSAREDLDDPSRRWDNTSDQLKREWELPEIYVNAKWEELDELLQGHIKKLWDKWSAKEEGIASVSGPPADSNMNIIGSTHNKKDEIKSNEGYFKCPLCGEDVLNKKGEGYKHALKHREEMYDPVGESLTDADLTKEDLTEYNLTGFNKTDYTLEESLLFEGFEYFPARIGHVEKHSDIIYENKLYTCESLGNCEFCGGKGKVTVERRGLKDCPDCDGTGDIGQNQMEQPIPNVIGDMQSPEITQDPAEQTAQNQIPQQPIPQEQVQTQPNGQAEPQKKKPFGNEGSTPYTRTLDMLMQNKISDYQLRDLIEQAMISSGENPTYDSTFDDDLSKRLKEKGEWSTQDEDYYAQQQWNDKVDDLLRNGFRNLPNYISDYIVNRLGTIGESKIDDWYNNLGKDDREDIDDDISQGQTKKELYKKFVKESCGCKKKAQEASIKKYKDYINGQIEILKSRARSGESVSLMYGLPTITKQGKKVKGTLAYAGVSLNDRIYLPEELAKGHGRTLPLLLNHSSTAGAEDELDRLDDNMRAHLENEEDYQVGEVTLTWDPEKLTLYYEGVIDHPFFQKEVDDMDMAVSLGIYYDSDSPQVCDENCYTLIKGAEFREVSLVYHAGFPIATIEAVEAELKAKARKAKERTPEEQQYYLDNVWDDNTGEDWVEGKEIVPALIVGGVVAKNQLDKAEEELDELVPTGQPIDVEPKPPSGDEITIEEPIIAEALTTEHNFSIRGVMGMTVSNSNGVERYRLDPNSNYGTNMIHFDVSKGGAQIYGEEIQMQPKMTTPQDLTKEIEKMPSIQFQEPDQDLLKKNEK